MTAAQRARLVIALGAMNLVLAVVALGISGPFRPTQQIAGATATPAASIPEFANASSSPAPVRTEQPGPSGGPPGPTEGPVGPDLTPQPSIPAGPGEASASPPGPPAPTTAPEPTTAPQPTTAPVPTTPPGPTSAPAPTPPAPATPAPTPVGTAPPVVPTAAPTPQPTSRPPVVKPPAGGTTKARPPCPGSVTGAPGHAKITDPDRPCKGGEHPASTAGTARPQASNDDRDRTTAGTKVRVRRGHRGSPTRPRTIGG